jgi:hypothetical protein
MNDPSVAFVPLNSNKLHSNSFPENEIQHNEARGSASREGEATKWQQLP